MKIEVIEQNVEILTSKEELSAIEKKLELCGRTCYKSEDRITNDSAGKFLRAIVRLGHESVLEHASVTVKFICSRSTSHQLVRHRLGSFSQESQRFCIYKNQLTVIKPLWLDLSIGIYKEHRNDDHLNEGSYDLDGKEIILYRNNFFFMHSLFNSYYGYIRLLENGINKEDAREVLPNACKTEVVATFNMRQWRHIFNERALNKHAQKPIRQLMQYVLMEISPYCPNIFFDQMERLEDEFCNKTE